MSVVWHDLECGAYVEDLPVWRSLAERCGDPVLDVGAGTGRIALDLAHRGHRVVALDRDPELVAELGVRGGGLPLETVVADARSFELEDLFPLCIVPMQTIQLLGGASGRLAFLACARRHLLPRGILAIALSEQLETYEVVPGGPAPLPDVRELDGVVYASQPLAVRAVKDGFVLERRREVIGPDGGRRVERNLIRLDRLDAAQLERDAAGVGLASFARAQVPATDDYAGSVVVMLRA